MLQSPCSDFLPVPYVPLPNALSPPFPFLPLGSLPAPSPRWPDEGALLCMRDALAAVAASSADMSPARLDEALTRLPALIAAAPPAEIGRAAALIGNTLLAVSRRYLPVRLRRRRNTTSVQSITHIPPSHLNTRHHIRDGASKPQKRDVARTHTHGGGARNAAFAIGQVIADSARLLVHPLATSFFPASPSLSRSDDVAVGAAQTLLLVGDDFHLERFAERKHAALVALLVHAITPALPRSGAAG